MHYTHTHKCEKRISFINTEGKGRQTSDVTTDFGMCTNPSQKSL